MTAYLDEAVVRAVNTQYLLFLIESIRATERAGCEHGAEPLCSPEEDAFLGNTERDLIAGRSLSPGDVERLVTIFGRGGSAPHPTLGNLKWLGKAVRILDAVSASLKEQPVGPGP